MWGLYHGVQWRGFTALLFVVGHRQERERGCAELGVRRCGCPSWESYYGRSERAEASVRRKGAAKWFEVLPYLCYQA